MAHNNLTYAIVPIAELNNIDYEQVMQDSADTVRKSVAEDLFVLKWDGAMPSSVSAITPAVTTYDHESILTEMGKAEWTEPDEE
jgi:hypothetical protein